ncbi:AAA family ATPase [Iningainema tapete]|uniref:ATP-dependent Clp protease ATP-binding subunit n=1 Tax=Iningainema tapete BLCC-T55 TaxID=2748662 RepID=A0A8J6XKA1_9CYAN|nr:AAA family ATPase [Iningainema tapete]MBD2773074.1 ATP-dependent Clp protease ATP-binding subunit [Iningainema tapete BLCC-T55]
MFSISARWIQEFEKHLYRRQHLILYSNIHDQFLWQGTYQGMGEFLNAYFLKQGFDLIVRYDPVDGFTFAQSEMRQLFDELARQRSSQQQVSLGQSSTPATPAADPMQPPSRANPGAVVQRITSNYLSPEMAFSHLRAVISTTTTSVVAIVDLGDMLTADPERYLLDERHLLMLLKKCTLEGAVIREGHLTGYRNTLILLASDLRRVPAWFYTNNPFVALVQVSRPNKEERLQFILRFGQQGFYGGNQINAQRPSLQQPSDLEVAAEEFAALTEGFQTMDLEAIRHTSWRERIPLSPKTVLRLIDFYKFGQRDEPFEKISADKIAYAQEELSQSVIGQPRAVEAVTTLLTSAKVGISLNHVSGRNSKPKGIFFFVGPTGVGKTELAKSLTRLIFGDEQAFARFDMSEYKEEHAAEKLAGSPPGFVGYEEGGILTNRVLERPYSILLFDEIEKAHPKVLDKFLQILEDGRLTDSKGQTAYFNQTVIIFTSNIGASDLTDPQTGAVIRNGIMTEVQQQGVNSFTYAQVEAHFRSEVHWHFTSRIGRAELLNRLGDSIVVFDLLRPEFVWKIGEKFIKQLAESAWDKYRLILLFHTSILEVLSVYMQAADNLLFGGRRIKTLLETLVERPLNRWIFENYPDFNILAGKQLIIGLGNNGVILVTENLS